MAATFMGKPSVRGSSETVRMILLTFISIGITFTWGVEMTYCTPYLLNLGLTKSNTSLVWIAGPLSGLIVQPIVGVVADGSTSRWGRRRPFIVAGTAIVAASMLVLGFTREIVGVALARLGGDDEERARRPTIVVAVLAIYVTDFAINAVMSCSMSLIVDTLPIEKQQTGTAWSSRMSSIGHVIGYSSGAIDLVGLLGTTLGNTQFKQLTVIAALTILTTSSITCWSVTERILVSSSSSSASAGATTRRGGLFKVFRRIWSTVLNLPPRVSAICQTQFWSWIGWFPFMFYNTTWVGETYFRYDATPEARASKDILGKMGRIGSTSLVIYSSITFTSAFLLPLIVKSPADDTFTARPLPVVAKTLRSLSKFKPDLLSTWIAGQVGFSIAMSMAPFATSYRFATTLVCLCGLPWTIAQWAPMTFLGVEVNRLSTGSGNTSEYQRLADAQEFELTSRASSDIPLSLLHGDGQEGDEASTGHGDHVSSTGELSGIYFGILNIFTTLPQFVGTFISAIVFAILDPGKSPELAGGGEDGEVAAPDATASGPNAISVCLFIGAMSSLYGAYVTRRLRHL